MKHLKHKRRLSEIVEKNIRTISDIEQAVHDSRTPADKIVDRIAGFCGSMTFLWFHCILVIGWLVINWFPQFKTTLRFDPPPFGFLTVFVSQEAILLSTFILISQNRQQKLATQRNHLELQINLLAEQETSHLIVMLTSLLDHHGIKLPDGDTLALQGETDAAHLSESIASGNI